MPMLHTKVLPFLPVPLCLIYVTFCVPLPFRDLKFQPCVGHKLFPGSLPELSNAEALPHPQTVLARASVMLYI